MLPLHPPIKPYNTHSLAVDDIHELYVEECGNPDGIPIVYLHGGPGAACWPDSRRFFNPKEYRIILFDQRGCGRSSPHGVITNNTTEHLIQDIETIREKLNIEQWALHGTSWGSALALLYAQSYPKRVLGMIVRCIFLAREQDIAWFQKGTPKVFPDYWEELIQHIPIKENSNMLEACHKLLFGKDEIARIAAAKAWAAWVFQSSALKPHPKHLKHYIEGTTPLNLARIACHYFINNCFIKPNQILSNMDAIKTIPGLIVHGRFDVLCPLQQAWELNQAWPASELHIIRDAAHSSADASLIDAIIKATDDLLTLIK